MTDHRITIDDFESVIQYYKTNSDWQTPDPSNATATAIALSEGYYRGSYHSTNVTGDWLALNFTGELEFSRLITFQYVNGFQNLSIVASITPVPGTNITLYGNRGDLWGTYEVDLDGTTTSHSAWASQGCIGCVLFQQANLTAGPTHYIKITNGNASILLDYLELTIQDGAAGANITNTTVVQTDPRLTYTGTWGNNTSPIFYGGKSTFTNSASSVSLTFEGSTIYAWGDTNANHGPYTVTLDSNPPVTLNSVTGCGLPYEVKGLCERTEPGLVYFQSYLAPGNHTIKIENVPGANGSFFDLNRITFSTPSSYFISSNSSTPSPSGSTSPTSSPKHSSNAFKTLATPNLAGGNPDTATFLLALFCIWITISMRFDRS